MWVECDMKNRSMEVKQTLKVTKNSVGSSTIIFLFFLCIPAIYDTSQANTHCETLQLDFISKVVLISHLALPLNCVLKI